MNETDFEARIRSLAAGMDYPRTPDIAVAVKVRPATGPFSLSKAIRVSLALSLVVLLSLMLIPPARAAILEFIQVGVVRIFRTEPAPPPPPTQLSPASQAPVTATPAPTYQALIPVLRDLAGEVTFEEAQKRVSYPLLLPSYPADLGQPDYVFVQDVENAITILVWVNPQKPDEVLMSLHFLPAGSWAIKKIEPTVIEETRVNGQYALWTAGPYVLRMKNGDMELTRLVNGHVLIWEQGTITYRLETALPLEDALKVAESLQPVPAPK